MGIQTEQMHLTAHSGPLVITVNLQAQFMAMHFLFHYLEGLAGAVRKVAAGAGAGAAYSLPRRGQFPSTDI